MAAGEIGSGQLRVIAETTASSRVRTDDRPGDSLRGTGNYALTKRVQDYLFTDREDG